MNVIKPTTYSIELDKEEMNTLNNARIIIENLIGAMDEVDAKMAICGYDEEAYDIDELNRVLLILGGLELSGLYIS